MNELSFNDLNLHDSSILKIELLLDHQDEELLSIWLDYIEDYNSHKVSVTKLVFEDCREIRLLNHLGFHKGNSIAEGGIQQNSDLLHQAQVTWKDSGAATHNWKHFYLHTNTGSKIDVVAQGFRLEIVDMQ